MTGYITALVLITADKFLLSIPNRLIGRCGGTGCSAMNLPTRPGKYELAVSNANGDSNALLFTVN